MGKIYVVLSAKNLSGGGESLHQLVSSLRKRGAEAFVYYFDHKRVKVSDRFEKYHVPIAKKIEDNFNNLIIVPEVYTGYLVKVKNAKRIVWWLSVDFFEESTPVNVARHYLKKKNLPLLLLPFVLFLAFTTNRFSMIQRFDFFNIDFEKERDILHFFNCEYAKRRLQSFGIKKEQMFYLCGPLSKNHLNSNCSLFEKQNIVAYNPKKGLDFTNKVIRLLKEDRDDIIFKRIEHMTPEEVNILLKEAKLYIDFGFFPGPERIPREAVSANCLVITGKDGAAGNDIDVPIPSRYKFEKNDSNLNDIIKEIINCIDHYSELINDFDQYRAKVREQVEQFDSTVNEIVKISKGR